MLLILGIHQVQQMPVIKKYVDAITNNILSGSETFQGDFLIYFFNFQMSLQVIQIKVNMLISFAKNATLNA